MKFNETGERKDKKVSKLWIIILGLVFVAIIGYKFAINNNVAGNYVMIEPIRGSGSFEAIMEPGRYYIGANRAYTWDKSSTSWFSKDLTEGEGCDESVPVRYNDGGTARVSGSVRYTIGYNETSKETKQKSRKQFTKLHIQYRDQDNFRDRAIQPLVTEVLTLTSTLMSAEESYTTNKAQFTEWALDQLNHGVYLVETYTDTIVLSTGEKKQVRKSKLKIKQGTKNEIMRKEYALKDFDVKFTQFVISDPEYHQSIKDQITGKLTNLMGKVASIAEAELNAAKETTAIAVGQRNVVKSEYEQKVVNVTDIIQSEINAAKERIPAEARNKVSSILKEAAEYQRDADIYDGEGEASYKMALQKADSNMEVRLKLWLIGHQSRAAIIAKNGKITPDFVLPEGTQVDTGMALINYDIMKRASSK